MFCEKQLKQNAEMFTVNIPTVVKLEYFLEINIKYPSMAVIVPNPI